MHYTGMKVLSVKVPEMLERKLAAFVKRRGAAKSDVVREALEQYLGKTERAHRGSVLELAGELVGCVKDAPQDLSTNSRHLADFGK
jgi:metal-responsive CopG/Arc/MetJ family transcriptional regulator